MKPTPCIDSETLAAFVDGALGGSERRLAEEHLAACPDCYEVFSETTRCLQESRPIAAASPASVPRRGVPTWMKVGLPLAAAAGLAAVLLGPFWRDSPLPERRATDGPSVSVSMPPATAAIRPDAVALLDPGREAATLTRWAWSEEPAAPAFAPVVRTERTSLLLGVYSLDLALALRAGDAGRSTEAVGRILKLLEATSGAVALMEHHRALQAEVGSGRIPPELADRSRSPEDALREAGLDPELVELGECVESARIAALTGRVHFLELDETQRKIGAASHPSLPTAAVRQLDEAGRLLRARQWGATDLRRLEHALSELIRRM